MFTLSYCLRKYCHIAYFLIYKHYLLLYRVNKDCLENLVKEESGYPFIYFF